jgi:5-oxoprolinase (ATP-hydrolysing) subunit A
MPVIDLNCDLGEGYASDALLMPYISSANIACGYHAGDADTMKRTVELCLQYGVAIGAHPSYPDRENFGRIDMIGKGLREDDLPEILAAQINTLAEICKASGAVLHHVKPHGALYNRAAWDGGVAGYIASTINDIDPSLIFYGQSGSEMETEAGSYELAFMREVFADRTYEDDGRLRARSQPDALITDTHKCITQVLQMIREGKVTTITGKAISMKAETVCLHGDGAHAVDFAKAIHSELTGKGIIISHER